VGGKRRAPGLGLYPPGALKPGRSWYIRGTYRGVEVYRSAGTGERAAAQQRRREIEREIDDGRYPPGDGKGATFSEAALIYLKTCPQSQVPYVKRLIEFYKDDPLDDFRDPAKIEAAVEALYPGGPTPRDRPSPRNATINRNLIIPLAAVLHMAARRNMMAWLRLERYPEPPPKNRAETPANVKKLLDALPVSVTNAKDRERYPRAAARFLFGTGARIGEMLGLEWLQVNLARREAILFDTKNGDTYTVPLHPAVYDDLARLPHRDGAVFGYRDRWEFYDDWNPACVKAGLKDFTPHAARHTYATWHRQGGQDLKALMGLGRWKSLQSVVRYAHVTAEEQREAVEALPLNERKTPKREKSVKGKSDVA
jgi:integrase